MSDHLFGLNPPQLKAVETTSGPLLVLAGAGTGKTRVVTCRIAEILSRGIGPDAICAVTFTNKAAKEMRERVQGLLKGRDVSEMVVSTFHSLGLRILREYGMHLGIPKRANIADESDQTSILTDVLREAGISRKHLRPKDAKWKISGWKNAGLLPDDAMAQADPGIDSALAVAYERYELELRRQKLLDFDDLILRPLELFREHPEVLEVLQNRWHYVMVDEYQDSNGCQYEMVTRLAGPRKNLCVVGDDDQSIYAWRGADPERILRFTREFQGAEVVALEQNYRSTGRILEAANTLIVTNSRRREKELWSALGPGEAIALYAAEDDKDEMDFVVRQIQALRESDGISFEDIAILFRANAQCRPLETALRSRDFPYRVVGTRSFFDRREIRDLLAFLRVARNPDDDAGLLRIINTPARGIGKSSIDKVIAWAAESRKALWPTLRERLADLPARTAEGCRALMALIDGVIEQTQDHGVGHAMAWLVEESAYPHHLRQITDDPLDLQTRLKVVEEFVDSAKESAQRGQNTLDKFLDALSLREERNKDREEDSEGITLLTMHAAKGLEYKTVFIVGMEEGILPHRNSIAEVEESIGDDTKAVEEERRLAYVGITRAKERLFLSYATKRARFGKMEDREPSRFIEEIGRDTMHVTDSSDRTPASDAVASEMLRQIRARFASKKTDASSSS